jgi:hypothetical protein
MVIGCVISPLLGRSAVRRHLHLYPGVPGLHLARHPGGVRLRLPGAQGASGLRRGRAADAPRRASASASSTATTTAPSCSASAPTGSSGWPTSPTARPVRLFSGNFPRTAWSNSAAGETPPPKSAAIADTWARFPYGVDFILRREGFRPGAGYRRGPDRQHPRRRHVRSASLSINLMLARSRRTGSRSAATEMRIVDLAQAVENDYIGSPCGSSTRS